MKMNFTGQVEPINANGKETGRFRTTGTYIKTELITMVTEVTPYIPYSGIGPTNIITTTFNQTDIGNTLDIPEYIGQELQTDNNSRERMRRH